MRTNTVHLLAGIASLGLISAGCWMAWQPLGLIAPGALLLSGIIAVRRYKPIPPTHEGEI